MIRAGVAFRFGALPTRIEKLGDGALSVALSDGTALEVDQVLVATGRHPYTEGLGLERVGVEAHAARRDRGRRATSPAASPGSMRSATSPITST